MELALGPADAAFREEVRTFLREELPDDIRERWNVAANVMFADKEDTVRWQKILHRRGWMAPNWPVEWGGTGWTVTQKYIFDTEMNRAGAPPPVTMGYKMVAPVLMRYGTDEQKRYFLPRILASDDFWCQGYSEPGAGSDLASLGCRARRDGDHYVVDGSKIWTTHAHFADWMFALVRTSREPKKQQGISFLLIDMTTPGIIVRPLEFFGGLHELNQVFFDGVRVPVGNRLGPEGDGWTVAKYLLEFERGGGFFCGRVMNNLERLRRAARLHVANGRPLAEDPGFRRRIAELEIAVEALAHSELRVLSRLGTGQSPGPASSLIKKNGSELNQAVSALTMEALGWLACPFDRLAAEGRRNDVFPAAVPQGAAATHYFNYRAASIMGGSTEIQKEIVAKAFLGL